jgi:hypothetical protein
MPHADPHPPPDPRKLTRAGAMAARPCALPVKRRETDAKGDLRLTVAYERTRLQRWLGASDRCERTYALDALGREVYEQCDGKRSVRDIAAAFAERHTVSLAEAEYSVTAYLRTLTAKGLVAMAVVGDPS